MPKRSPESVSQTIQRLVEQRQAHLDAVTQIDATLARVGAALNGSTAGPVAAPTASTTNSAKKRRRKKYKVSGEASILAFIKQQKNPTTQQIKELWASEGRGGTSANVLTKLTSDGKIKRTPLKDQPGSRFTLA